MGEFCVVCFASFGTFVVFFISLKITLQPICVVSVLQMQHSKTTFARYNYAPSVFIVELSKFHYA